MASDNCATRGRVARIAGFVLFALILIALTAVSAQWVLSLREGDNLRRFQAFLDALGPAGWLVLLFVQYFQIVVAFVPGGPVQLAAGALAGPVGGMLLCLLGTVLATATVFALVSRYGRRVLELFVGKQDIGKYKFLQDSKRLEFLALVLFFIPGTPKDALTYLFAFTPIRMKRFVMISAIARFPAMLTSVLAGDSIANGEWLRALILFILISVISLGGLLLHKKIMDGHSGIKRRSGC